MTIWNTLAMTPKIGQPCVLWYLGVNGEQPGFRIGWWVVDPLGPKDPGWYNNPECPEHQLPTPYQWSAIETGDV